MKRKKLNELRKKIDAIDSSIVKLLNKRGAVSRSIGAIKRIGKEPIYSPDRESRVYDRVASLSKGPLSGLAVRSVYREIMSACLSLEEPLTVAYLGPEFTFTHQVSMKKFGSSVKYLPCGTISEVFGQVEKGSADYGVVPIENSIEGAINHTLDLFVDSPVYICSEAYLRIRHSVLSKARSLREIDTVYSNPQVFGQCRVWLEKNLSRSKLKDASSTAEAAFLASKHKKTACIASELAAEKHGLRVLARGIEDSADNVTRFLIIGGKMAGSSGKDRTSIMFSAPDKPGMLLDSLVPFKKRKINLSMIESRPSKKKAWKYYFFLDMDGHIKDKKVKAALKELEGKCNFLKVLGSYPKA